VGLARRDAGAAHAAYEKQKYATALELARPLAEAGDSRARTLLGLLYYNGRGVPKDIAEAASWFRLAADQGDAQAQFHLGNMHSEGLGVPQDYGEAVKWYRRAADQNGAPCPKRILQMWAVRDVSCRTQ
jgi:TPR repeat protein